MVILPSGDTENITGGSIVGIEIERKFLIKNEGWRELVTRSTRMRQGYLSSDKNCSVRVRVAGEQAHVNIKSATLGVTRDEYEYPIPLEDAEQLLAKLCVKPLIEKTRHHVNDAGREWEVDEFEGDNQGLLVAEAELTDADDPLAFPDWLGKDVSMDPKYYNICLVKHPFRNWTEVEKRISGNSAQKIGNDIASLKLEMRPNLISWIIMFAAWALVSAPLAWGIWVALEKAVHLFQ
jgi:adenylate cyclase